MDIRERWENIEEIIRAAVEAKQAEIQTAMPGIVESVDFAQQTMSVRPALKSVVRKQGGGIEHAELPILQDVPIQFTSGGGHTMTFPIKKGDEVLLVFSSRPLDTWHQSGDVQQQIDARMHHLSDAIAIPGVRSSPRALQNVSTNSVQLRSDDGKNFVEVGENGVKLQRDEAALAMDMSGNISVVPGSGGKIYMG